jgi:hypothetical protein
MDGLSLGETCGGAGCRCSSLQRVRVAHASLTNQTLKCEQCAPSGVDSCRMNSSPLCNKFLLAAHMIDNPHLSLCIERIMSASISTRRSVSKLTAISTKPIGTPMLRTLSLDPKLSAYTPPPFPPPTKPLPSLPPLPPTPKSIHWQLPIEPPRLSQSRSVSARPIRRKTRTSGESAQEYHYNMSMSMSQLRNASLPATPVLPPRELDLQQEMPQYDTYAPLILILDSYTPHDDDATRWESSSEASDNWTLHTAVSKASTVTTKPEETKGLKSLWNKLRRLKSSFSRKSHRVPLSAPSPTTMFPTTLSMDKPVW